MGKRGRVKGGKRGRIKGGKRGRVGRRGKGGKMEEE